ncbi:MAG: cysteine desulfurase family protein [Pseudomonadota bacterium]
MANAVYLDYNATAPVKPRVVEVVAEAMASVGNPSSVHAAGRAARKRLSRARGQIAALVGASPDQVIFTSGGTEANNQALKGEGKVAVSAIEHPSVLALADEDHIVPVNADGVIDLQALDELLRRQRPSRLAVMMANNESGVIQPVKDVAAIAREASVRLHIDAIQAAGKTPIDFIDLGADTLSLSAHKIGGPQGVGALIVRPGVEPASLLKGGAQESRHRAGTENLPGIVGFGEAAALAGADPGFKDRVSALRDRLESAVLQQSPEVRIAGGQAARLPNTSCLVFPGISHETQLIHFDLAGIAVSAGSACSSGKIGPSPVLMAMGFSTSDAASGIRVSLGWNSTDEDVDHFINACRELLARTQRTRSQNVRMA